jgi:hypothetical protein
MLKKINFLILIAGLLILQIGAFAQSSKSANSKIIEPLPVPSIPPFNMTNTTKNITSGSLDDQNDKSVPVIAVTQQITFRGLPNKKNLYNTVSAPVTFYYAQSEPHTLMKITYPAHSDGTISPEGATATGTTNMYFVTNNNNDTYLARVSYYENNSQTPDFTWKLKADHEQYIFETAPNFNLDISIRNPDNSYTNPKNITPTGISQIASWDQWAINPTQGTSYNSLKYTKGNSMPNLSDEDYKNLSSLLKGFQGTLETKTVPQPIIKKGEDTKEAILK